jgi:hypothetical protein
MTIPSPDAPAKRRKRWPLLVAGAAVLAVLAVVTYLPRPSTEDRAVAACQDEIKGKLQAPATGK